MKKLTFCGLFLSFNRDKKEEKKVTFPSTLDTEQEYLNVLPGDLQQRTGTPPEFQWDLVSLCKQISSMQANKELPEITLK